MGRPKQFEPDEAVERAMRLFWSKGFEATSVSDLVEALGVNRYSLYETFGSKRALFTRVLEGYLADVIDPRLAPLDRPGAGFDALVTYFENFGAFFQTAPANLAGRGCLLLNTATELAVLDDDAAAMVENYRRRMAGVFLAVLTQAVRDGDLETAEPAEDATRRRAELLTAQVVGLFLTSRLSLPAAAGLATAIAAEIRSWRPSHRP
jgi:AcrR family transcriptional regulator